MFLEKHLLSSLIFPIPHHTSDVSALVASRGRPRRGRRRITWAVALVALILLQAELGGLLWGLKGLSLGVKDSSPLVLPSVIIFFGLSCFV